MKTAATGPFYCIQNKIHTPSAALAAQYPGPALEAFPQGRVAYRGGVYHLCMDRCLDYLPAIMAVLAAFGIEAEPWAEVYDDRCQCAACKARASGAAVVFDASERPAHADPGALAGLDKSLYPAFEAALNHAFAQMLGGYAGWAGAAAWVSPRGRVMAGRQKGTPLPYALAHSESQMLEIACKYALATVQGKPLVLFRPTRGVSPEKAPPIRAFLASLPPGQVIVSDPFADP